VNPLAEDPLERLIPEAASEREHAPNTSARGRGMTAKSTLLLARRRVARPEA